MPVLNRVLKLAGIQSHQDRDTKLYNDLIKHEARIGGKLFGPAPKDGRRDFFCLDEHTWVWHEEWKGKDGKMKNRTTRYEVRPDSVVKINQNNQYQMLSKAEAARFFEAMRAYERSVKTELYQR